jgi:hypothetical protein
MYRLARLRLVQHQGPHRRLFHQPHHRIHRRRRGEDGPGLPHGRRRCWTTGPPATMPAARATTSPPGRTGRKSSARSSSISTRWKIPRIPPRPIWTRWPPRRAIPPSPPTWHDNAFALWNDAWPRPKGKRPRGPMTGSAAWTIRTKTERGNVTGQLVLNDPQAATTKLPNLTVGLAHPDYTGTGGAFAKRSGNGNLVTWPHDGNYYQFWNRWHRGRQVHHHQRPPRHLHAPRLCRRRAGRIRQDRHHRRGRQEYRPGQARLEARPLRQAGLGNRLPQPQRRRILQGRRRQLLALGLGMRYATCSPTTSPTPSARAIGTRTGSSRKCRTRPTSVWSIPPPRIPPTSASAGSNLPTAPGQDMWRRLGPRPGDHLDHQIQRPALQHRYGRVA